VRRATACVLLLVLALAGCGSDNSKDDQAAAARAHARAQAKAQAARQARLVAAGKPVFQRFCAACHTLQGRKAHPPILESPIPNLDEVKPAAEYVRERVEVGGFDMASFSSEIPPEQIAAVVAYVTEVSGSRITEPDADEQQLAMGEQVFGDNCARCHGIAGRRMTGRPTYPGTDFSRVKPNEAFVIRQATRGIQYEMPSFRNKLTRAQLQAVAAYVTTTAGE
jgi:cbb3-type cytochrome c oxidase subunit III